jgi:hypothetical protein
MEENKDDKNKNLLMQYAGMGMQLLVALGLAVFIGIKLDEWMKISFPVFVLILPLAVLIIIFIKVLKDTSNK